MSDKKISSLVTKTLELARRPAVHFFDLARLIRKLHELDPACIPSLAEKTGISPRRLYYYLDVGRLIDEHNVGQPKAEEVGWTKLQIIARHVKAKGGASTLEISKFIELALETTALTLRQDFRRVGTVPLQAVVFQLRPNQRKELDDALVAFGAKTTYRGLAEKEAALMRLVRTSLLQRT